MREISVGTLVLSPGVIVVCIALYKSYPAEPSVALVGIFALSDNSLMNEVSSVLVMLLAASVVGMVSDVSLCSASGIDFIPTCYSI